MSEELRDKEAADYLEGLLEGFVAYDANWVMTYMNAAGERILGRRREDVLGKTWHQAFPHAVGNPVDHMYQRVMRTRRGETASAPRRRCARTTGARTSSSPRWRTSCATRWRRSAAACRCCRWRSPAATRRGRRRR
ncbi:MAG: PAS domain-containing protein [Betaproteobacteria bacterium]